MNSSLHPTLPLAIVPSHGQIAQYAHELWSGSGCPAGQDDRFWLEAERRLVTARRTPKLATETLQMLARQRARTRVASREFLAALYRTRTGRQTA